nr:MAG TPA: hypothetical protein [Microviridae sp.]
MKNTGHRGPFPRSRGFWGARLAPRLSLTVQLD